MTNAELEAAIVKGVRDHAVANYETDGWDFLVECWSDEEILAAASPARSVKSAITRVKKHMQPLAERRAEIQSEAF